MLNPPASQNRVTVCLPAASVTGTCTDWYAVHPPVLGSETVASLVSAASRNDSASGAGAPDPLACRTSRSYVPAWATSTRYFSQFPVAVHPMLRPPLAVGVFSTKLPPPSVQPCCSLYPSASTRSPTGAGCGFTVTCTVTWSRAAPSVT
jgi:hypothetical protein